jgi:hypothetical protein
MHGLLLWLTELVPSLVYRLYNSSWVSFLFGYSLELTLRGELSGANGEDCTIKRRDCPRYCEEQQ